MVEILVATATGTLGTIAASVILSLWHIKVGNHVRIARITSTTDVRLQQLKCLYNDLFPENAGTNYSAEYIPDLLDPKYSDKRLFQIENIILTATYKGEVVGFVFCHYYPEPRKAIISYYGLIQDRTHLVARGEAPLKLLVKLRKILRKRNCDYLFFDLRLDNNAAPKGEAARHKSRWLAFSRRAREVGLYAGMFCFDYICPRVCLDEQTHEEPFTLHCIPLNGDKLTVVSKKEMVKFIEFIYFYCFGDFYSAGDPEFIKHCRYLNKIVKHYRDVLPDKIMVS